MCTLTKSLRQSQRMHSTRVEPEYRQWDRREATRGWFLVCFQKRSVIVKHTVKWFVGYKREALYVICTQYLVGGSTPFVHDLSTPQVGRVPRT